MAPVIAPSVGVGRQSRQVESRPRRELVLASLRGSEQPRSIVSLADELGVHVNTVRFHLEALKRGGQVDQVLVDPVDPVGPGRPAALFRATRRMDPSGPTNYRLLATMLASHLMATSPDPIASARELGQAWAPNVLEFPIAVRARAERPKRTEALRDLHGVLTNLGFAPDPPTGSRDATIRLRHCPFLGLVVGPDVENGEANRGGVVCALHLGLMQGALTSLSAPVTVDQLDPLVEPDLCVAHLASRPPQNLVSGGADE